MLAKSRIDYRYLGLVILSVIVLFWLYFSILASPVNSTTKSGLKELRGVWLTNVGSGVLFSPWGIERCLDRLSKLNFNTVYPVVWNRGYTFYPSYTAKQTIGSDREPFLAITHPFTDVLETIVTRAKQKGLTVIPWFEYGLMVPKNSQIAKLHPDWLTETSKHDRTIPDTRLQTEKPIANRVWLNPFHPKVQQFIKELVLEVIHNYDVSGIQLDDNFAMPVEFGYDELTIKLYQQEHQGKSPPNNPRELEWMRWRAKKITDFVADIVKSVRIVNPQLIISLSPNSSNFSYNNYLQDWPNWVERGLIDELILQVYRDNLPDFTKELGQSAIAFAQTRIPVSVGIFTGNVSTPVKISTIQKQLQTIRDRHFDGVSFFYWESLWGYIAPESPQKRRQAFKTMFAEVARRPTLTVER